MSYLVTFELLSDLTQTVPQTTAAVLHTCSIMSPIHYNNNNNNNNNRLTAFVPGLPG